MKIILSIFALLLTPGAMPLSATTDATIQAKNSIVQTEEVTVLETKEFSINADQTLTIDLPNPSSHILIRVNGESPSIIEGTLTSNGSIVLVNEKGLTITESGTIRCDSFTGNTLNLETKPFRAKERAHFFGLSTAPILNAGTISCTKSVRLCSRGLVASTNTIHSPSGRIILEGGIVQVKGVLDVSGDHGEGKICIGGGFHGEDPLVRNAQLTVIDKDAVLRADANKQGDGGSVIIWSDTLTRFLGYISAVGKGPKGSGGSAEVASKKNLDFLGGIDLSATQGPGGPLIFD